MPARDDRHLPELQDRGTAALPAGDHRHAAELQSGDPYCIKLWQEFLDISLTHCQELYGRLNVSLGREHVMGESAYNDDLPKVVEDLNAAGLLTEDQGAQCVFLDEFKGHDGTPLPMIVQKQGGGFLYSTSDLAAIRYRPTRCCRGGTRSRRLARPP